MTTPVIPEAPEITLAVGIIAYLQSLQLLTWNPTGVYPTGFLGVAAYVQAWPQQPDRALTITPYAVTDDSDQAMSQTGLQIRSRWAGGDPRAVANYSGAVFDALHGLGPIVLPGGATMSQCLRRSGTSMGQDADRRWSWVDNYYVDFHRPSTHRS